MNTRLDQALVDRGLCSSKEQAKRAVLAGRVRVNQQSANKPGNRVRHSDQIEVLEAERFVSRGGYKLEHAVREFGLSPEGWVAVDFGASTGGFTDCLLQAGVRQVYAVDVGRGQLAWKLRNDPRVVVMEQTNARYLSRELMPEPFTGADLVTIDCSFISLRLLLGPAEGLLLPGGRIVALIKPQFEAGRDVVSRGRGVIRDEAVHEQVIESLAEVVEAAPGLQWRKQTTSPLQGPAGNTEFLVLLEKNK